MQPDSNDVRQVLADAWERWATRCGELTDKQWSTRTRCPGWDVRALVAHMCPDKSMFDELNGAIIDGPAAVTDPAALLRRFNEPGGIAHTTADDLAERAVADAGSLTAAAATARFVECARIVRETPMPQQTVIRYPVVESTTLAVVAEVALMEATVHLLDLADAVGGVEPSPDALAITRDLLIRVPDAVAVVEVLAGRTAPEKALPASR
jgi:uncharacterized protein (TIGR03083 family)